MARDDGELGRAPRLRHGRPLEPRPRRRPAPAGGGRGPDVHRHPPRRRRGLRRLGLRQAHRSAGGVPRHRRARRDEPVDRASGTPRSTARRCSRSPARSTRRCSARAPSRRSTWRRPSATSPPGPRRCSRPSNHAELMTLACKHAILRRDVAHLILPDEVQTLPAAAGSKASGPEGRLTPRDHPAGGVARRGGRAAVGRQAPGDHRRPRRALRHGRRSWPSPSSWTHR